MLLIFLLVVQFTVHHKFPNHFNIMHGTVGLLVRISYIIIYNRGFSSSLRFFDWGNPFLYKEDRDSNLQYNKKIFLNI